MPLSITAETVEKPSSIVDGWFLGGLMSPHNCEIVDCGAFCEVIFFCISLKALLRDFFDSLASAPGARIYINVVRNYARDEGWPLEAGLQEQASNHLKLHRLRAVVVSVKEKS